MKYSACECKAYPKKYYEVKGSDGKESLLYYDKESYYQELETEPDTRIVGTMRMSRLQLQSKKIGILELEGKDLPIYRRYIGKDIGYVYVDRHRFIAMKRPSHLEKICCFFIVLFLCALPVCAYYDASIHKKPIVPPIVENGSVWDGVLPQNGEKGVDQASNEIEIPGYAKISVSSSEPSIPLINSNGNTVYFKYIILNEQDILFESDLIKPGDCIMWNAKETLGKGEHQLKFVIETYDQTMSEQFNGAEQQVEVSVLM